MVDSFQSRIRAENTPPSNWIMTTQMMTGVINPLGLYADNYVTFSPLEINFPIKVKRVRLETLWNTNNFSNAKYEFAIYSSDDNGAPFEMLMHAFGEPITTPNKTLRIDFPESKALHPSRYWIATWRIKGGTVDIDATYGVGAHPLMTFDFESTTNINRCLDGAYFYDVVAANLDTSFEEPNLPEEIDKDFLIIGSVNEKSAMPIFTVENLL